MKLLLDTHTFLWYVTADPKLPAAHLAAIRDKANEVVLSVGSGHQVPVEQAALARLAGGVVARTKTATRHHEPRGGRRHHASPGDAPTTAP